MLTSTLALAASSCLSTSCHHHCHPTECGELMTTSPFYPLTGNNCNNNSQMLYSSHEVYRSSQSLHKELEENLQNHQGGVIQMQFYCCCPSDTETSLLLEELFLMKIPSKLTPLLRLSELQARPALSTHLVYPCVRTTSTASSIYTSSVSMCPNYKHCQLYLHI